MSGMLMKGRQPGHLIKLGVALWAQLGGAAAPSAWQPAARADRPRPNSANAMRTPATPRGPSCLGRSFARWQFGQANIMEVARLGHELAGGALIFRQNPAGCLHRRPMSPRSKMLVVERVGQARAPR